MHLTTVTQECELSIFKSSEFAGEARNPFLCEISGYLMMAGILKSSLESLSSSALLSRFCLWVTIVEPRKVKT